MATTTISIESLQTACAECADAIDLGDFVLARRKYAKAEAINSGLVLRMGQGSASVQARETLLGLKTAIESAAASVVATSDRKRFITTRVGFNP